MTLPDEDVAARARTIFDRLRAEHHRRSDRGPEGEVVPVAAREGLDFVLVEEGEVAPGEAERGAPDRDDRAASGFFGDQPTEAARDGGEGAGGEGDGGDRRVEAGVEGGAREGWWPGSDPGAGELPPGTGRDRRAPVPLAAAAEPEARGAAGGAPAPAETGAAASPTPGPLAADPAPTAPGSLAATVRPVGVGEVHPAAPTPAPRPDDPSAGHGAAASDGGPGPASPRVVAIANQKGGVGKTTTAVNLGAALAELGLRVLVVDLDPQGNATTGLGINSRSLDQSIYDVLLRDLALDDCIEPTSLRNLFVAPATIELAGAEIELVPAFSRELRLRRAVDEVRDDFDYVLIDCPPSLGLLTVNGLAAADEVLVPIQCEYYALEGLGQLLRNVNLVQANLNPGLEVSTIVLTMYDARTKLAEQVTREVRTHFGAKVCRNVVPRTVRLSEAPSFGEPITLFDPTSRGSIAYRELAKEVHRGPSQRAR